MCLKFVFAIIIAATLAGCGAIAERYRANPIIKRNTEKSTSTIYAEDGKSVDVTRPAFIDKIKAVDNAKDADKATLRNTLVHELMSLSDDVCELHKAGIISNSNTWNITTGSISNVLAGLGSVIPGETVKAGLLPVPRCRTRAAHW